MSGLRVTVLGCGGSRGVPAVGPDWGNCDPANPKNRRLRSSILVEGEGGDASGGGQGRVSILIDTSPDLREQLLAAEVSHLDAVLWTHAHGDHCHGIDDLREICRRRMAPLDVYGLPEHLDDIKTRFGYCFRPPKASNEGFYRPVLVDHPLERRLDIGGLEIRSFEQDHGWSKSVGYRFGKFAYSTDVVRLDEKAFEALEGTEVWIVDCQRLEPHPVHAHLDLTLEWINRVKPKLAYLTHMDQSMDYDTLLRRLPSGVEPAYDGLRIAL
ncbi:MBL fold metallo-hydrolase [Azospirillum sp. SYSU D00513]|uniref:MBL fold metallo-hydrolase n=1 Tax=Azospirillum sp. SYSU D00513 TaxID=2812561 RepID=UPI0032B3482A